MAIFDIVALGIIVVCILISMMRGVIAEVASLVIWVVAFLVAKMFAAPFAAVALTSVQPPQFAVAVGFILLFVAAWLVQHFLRSLLTSAVSAIGLGGVNRLLGAVFGAAKGVLIITQSVAAAVHSFRSQFIHITLQSRQSFSRSQFWWVRPFRFLL